MDINNNNTPLVSIIVPVYNTEQYVSECIESVLRQTYSNWELLMVNDGSTDSSLDVCTAYAIKDGRIKVWTKENSGVSATRNFALERVMGDFLIFLDSDDYWLCVDALERMVNLAIDNRLDVVRGEYNAVDCIGNIMYSSPIKRADLPDGILSSAVFFEDVIKGEFFLPLSLIRFEKFKHLRFVPERFFLEDMLIYSQLLLDDLRCYYLKDMLFYAYRKLNTSASNKFNPQIIADSFSMCYEFHHLSLLASCSAIRELYEQYSVSMYCLTLPTLAHEEYSGCRQLMIDNLQIEKLRKDVLLWMRPVVGIKRVFLVCLPARCAIALFSFKFKLTCVKNRLLKYMKKS